VGLTGGGGVALPFSRKNLINVFAINAAAPMSAAIMAAVAGSITLNSLTEVYPEKHSRSQIGKLQHLCGRNIYVWQQLASVYSRFSIRL
jgi:hypothetical protein